MASGWGVARARNGRQCGGINMWLLGNAVLYGARTSDLPDIDHKAMLGLMTEKKL
jgi:hypothetical protein